MQYGVTLSSLMTQGSVPPNITYEAITTPANYLYVKPHSSLWEAVTNLSLKVQNTYPYIAYPNMIRFTAPASGKLVTLSDAGTIMSVSDGNELSTVISHIHMKDTNGTYNTYNASSPFAADRSIVRHKYIDLDNQWLSDPQKGLSARLNFAARGGIFNSVTYKGFNGEDINDRFSILAVGFEKAPQFISRIDVFGGKNGIFTKLTAYHDGYCN